MIVTVVGWLLGLFLLWLSVDVLWLIVLTCAAAIGLRRYRRAQGEGVGEPRLRFLLLMPAHDEAGVVGEVLNNLRQTLQWPEALYEIVVVADNCSDATAEEAQPYATVLSRSDPENRGKGPALAWAAGQLATWPRPFDAVVVIDADTAVNPAFLAGFQAVLDSGDSPLAQAVNLVGNPEDGWRPALTYAGFAAMNFIRPAGRDTLGCSAGLMGTGMCYRRDFYLTRTYQSGGLAEDLEEGMRYRMEGIRTRFAYGSDVRSPMPVTGRNAQSQRARWEGGRRSVVKAWRLKMLKAWIEKPNRILFDGLMELDIPPLGQLGAMLAATFAVAALFQVWSAAAWAFTLMVLLGIHITAGLALTAAPASVYRRLFMAPVYVIWKLILRLTPRKNRGDQWVRTNREMKP